MTLRNLLQRKGYQSPEAVLEQGRLSEGRRALRRVLARRGLSLSTEQEARIEGCSDLEQLERWHDQAITAASADEVLG